MITYCIDQKKGSLLWERRLPLLDAQYGSNGSPVIFDSLLIVNRIEHYKPSILALNKAMEKQYGNNIWILRLNCLDLEKLMI